GGVALQADVINPSLALGRRVAVVDQEIHIVLKRLALVGLLLDGDVHEDRARGQHGRHEGVDGHAIPSFGVDFVQVRREVLYWTPVGHAWHLDSPVKVGRFLADGTDHDPLGDRLLYLRNAQLAVRRFVLVEAVVAAHAVAAVAADPLAPVHAVQADPAVY